MLLTSNRLASLQLETTSITVQNATYMFGAHCEDGHAVRQLLQVAQRLL
jgi:hypothetical protein